MEPNIKYADNCNGAYLAIYSKILSAKIKDVCSKINYSYDDITWIIFDPNDTNIHGEKINPLKKLMIGQRGIDYGACDCEDKIWISTLSIRKNMKKFDEKIKMSISTQMMNENDFLANVILDEITHMVTKCDHKTKKYDDQLKKFKNIYYNRKSLF